MSETPKLPTFRERRYSFPDDIIDYEDLEVYVKGGFHPVHLGDFFDNDRYKIVHKLGFGGYATVWLARDQVECKWVALKIVNATHSVAQARKNELCKTMLQDSGLNSEHIVVHERQFTFDGPNGRHLCLVLPVLGPAAVSLSYYMKCRLTPAFARSVAYGATKAIADLHDSGICHGGNLLLGVSDMNRYSEAELFQMVGEPKSSSLFLSGENTVIPPTDQRSRQDERVLAGPEGPEYVVENIDFLATPDNLLLPDVKLVDFDQSFPTSSPPDKYLGIPLQNLAPEIAMGRSASPASDVWALGCCILQLRSGCTPFPNHWFPHGPQSQIEIITETLGADPPQEWIETALFDSNGYPTKDTLKGEPTDFSWIRTTRTSVRDQVFEIWDEPADRCVQIDGLESQAGPWASEERNRPYPPCFAAMVWRPKAIRLNDGYMEEGYTSDWDTIKPVLPKIPKHEAELLSDLLDKIFVYLPEQRPTAREILSHPWFHMGGRMDLENEAS